LSAARKAAAIKPVIFGLSGPGLSAAERAFFASCRPIGFILFARNCRDPVQLKALVAELRAFAGPQALVLIDQEGGRVQRLGPPHWDPRPAAARFGELYARDAHAATSAVRDHARLIGAELADLGIDVDCWPVLDVPGAGSHEVIGDRAFGRSAEMVAILGRAAAAGLLASGVLPVLKHMPGHGRAGADSHRELPIVLAAHGELAARDFIPFKALADMPLAMTAHVLYRALDDRHPATTSKAIIEGVIRREIGFGGVLITDDIGMAALAGPLPERGLAALGAGCDLVLHCSGNIDEMDALAQVLPPITKDAAGRISRARSMRGRAQPLDRAGAQMKLDRLLAMA
jgi:beta-N-acetylhexosaminidase